LGLITLIKDAVEANKQLAVSELKIFGSPWSPPSWMKNGDHTMVGSLSPCLKEDDRYKQAWARYFGKWAQAYENQIGIAIWGFTVQNEPAF